MSDLTTPAAAASQQSAQSPSPHARLRASARQLEGVFVGQLLKAMRASASEGGLTGISTGEQLFTELFDERMAQEAALRSRNGIGEAIYRQMARRLSPETVVSDAPEIR